MTTTTTMNTYEKAVAANMEHMKSAVSEWSAVAISGFSNTTDDKGQAVKMPQFVFPVGYSSAPSLYKNQNAACGINCELCGHDIKNVYWLQNDSRKWTLAVGSECVTRFGAGKSGNQLADEVRRQQNRELVTTLLDQVKAFKRCFSFSASRGYGRTETAWNSNEAYRFHRATLKLLGKLETDSTDGAISGFITRKGDQARQMMQENASYLKSATAISRATSVLRMKQGEQNSIVVYGRINGQAVGDLQKADAQRRASEYASDIAKIEAAKDCLAITAK